MEIKRKIFGTDEHTSIAGTLSNIGLVYDKLEALVNFEKSLTIDKSGTGEQADAFINIAFINNVYEKLDKKDEALKNIEKTLEIIQRDFNTINKAAKLNKIANFYNRLDKCEQALINYEKSLSILRKIHGTNEHPFIAYTLNNIASVYNKLERYTDALETYDLSLKKN